MTETTKICGGASNHDPDAKGDAPDILILFFGGVCKNVNHYLKRNRCKRNLGFTLVTDGFHHY